MHVTVIEPEISLFTVSGVLSPQECEAFVASTEAAGYDDAPITTARGFVMAPQVRNNTRVMVDDEAQAQWLFERLRPHLPAEYAGDRLVGLNERFRFYRYHEGQYFRWHYDGAYVRSDTERSRLTLMVYLNEGFLGGETDFSGIGSVQPERGMALLFDHHVLHQGAEIFDGCKYVLRTDVMYRLPVDG